MTISLLHIKNIIFGVTILLASTALTQNQANIWCFGINAGLDFNNGLFIVFKTNRLYESWNGTNSNKKEAAPGTYFYTVRTKDHVGINRKLLG